MHVSDIISQEKKVIAYFERDKDKRQSFIDILSSVNTTDIIYLMARESHTKNLNFYLYHPLAL